MTQIYEAQICNLAFQEQGGAWLRTVNLFNETTATPGAPTVNANPPDLPGKALVVAASTGLVRNSPLISHVTPWLFSGNNLTTQFTLGLRANIQQGDFATLIPDVGFDVNQNDWEPSTHWVNLDPTAVAHPCCVNVQGQGMNTTARSLAIAGSPLSLPILPFIVGTADVSGAAPQPRVAYIEDRLLLIQIVVMASAVANFVRAGLTVTFTRPVSLTTARQLCRYVR